MQLFTLILLFGLNLAVFISYFYIYFNKPSLLESNLWTDNVRLKKYLDKHFVNLKVAKEIIYRQSQRTYSPLVYLLASFVMMVMVLYFIFLGKSIDYTFMLANFSVPIYSAIGIFSLYKGKEFKELIDEKKINSLIENKSPITPIIPIINNYPIKKGYYYSVILIFVIGICITFFTCREVLFPEIVVSIASLTTLYFIDNQPFNYMFTKDIKKWGNLALKQKHLSSLGIIFLQLSFFFIIIFVSLASNGIIK